MGLLGQKLLPLIGVEADGSSTCTSSRSEEHTSELQSLTNLVLRSVHEKHVKKLPKNCGIFLFIYPAPFDLLI